MSTKARSAILAAHMAKKTTKTIQVAVESDDSMNGDVKDQSESPKMPKPVLMSSDFEVGPAVVEKSSTEKNSGNFKDLKEKNSAALSRMAKVAAESTPSSDDSTEAKKPKVMKFCLCRKGKRPARQATVKTAGPNFGRVYYCCDRDRDDDNNCKYFEWGVTEEDRKYGVFCKCVAPGADEAEDDESSEDDSDDDGSKAIAKRLAKKRKQDESRMPAVRQVVKNNDKGNMGRAFFSCRSGREGCSFFQWDNSDSAKTKTVAAKKRVDSSDDDSDDDNH